MSVLTLQIDFAAGWCFWFSAKWLS